jgi:hypothetical protein
MSKRLQYCSSKGRTNLGLDFNDPLPTNAEDFVNFRGESLRLLMIRRVFFPTEREQTARRFRVPARPAQHTGPQPLARSVR